MCKSKLPDAYVNIIKAAVLCGAALQMIPSAHAGWNKEIAAKDGIGETELRILKAGCSSSLQALVAKKDVDKDSDAFKAKKDKWIARGTRVMNLKTIIHNDKTITVEEKKNYLFDKQSYKDALLKKNPNIREIKGDQQAAKTDTHAMSIFEAKSMIVKETKEEANEDYLRAYFAESGLPADEQERQLKAMLALNKASATEEKTNSTNTINSSPKPTNTKPEVKVVEEKTNNNNTNNSSRFVVKEQIDELKSLFGVLGDTPEGKSHDDQIQERLELLEMLRDKGIKFYANEEEFNDLCQMFPKKAPKTEERPNNNSNANNNNSNATNNSSPKATTAKTEVKVAEEKTTVTINNSGTTKLKFNVKTEIAELEQNMPMIEQWAPTTQKNEAKTRLQKLKAAQNCGIVGYNDESELDDAIKTLQAISQNGTVTIDSSPKPTITKAEKKVVEETKLNNTNSSSLSPIQEEIRTLESILPALGNSPEDKRQKSIYQARLTKLELLNQNGDKSYENDEVLNKRYEELLQNASKAKTSNNSTTQLVEKKLINIAQKISEVEGELAIHQNYGTGTEEEKKTAEKLREDLSLLKNAQTLGIEAYEDISDLVAYNTLAPVKTTPKFNIAQEILDREQNLPWFEANVSPQDLQKERTKLQKLKNARDRGMKTYTNEQELG